MGQPLIKHDPVKGLIDHPAKTGNGQWQRIDHDLFPQREVQLPLKSLQQRRQKDQLEEVLDHIGQQHIGNKTQFRLVDKGYNAVGMRL